MANSRIYLTCKHCGGYICLGKGYFGCYSTRNEQIFDDLNEFFREHEMGLCSDEADASDDAKNHFVILEEGDEPNEQIR